jgi:hypothetical protein
VFFTLPLCVSRLTAVLAVDYADPYLPKRHAKRVLLGGHHRRGNGRQPASVDPRLHSKLRQAPTVSDAAWAPGELIPRIPAGATLSQLTKGQLEQ